MWWNWKHDTSKVTPSLCQVRNGQKVNLHQMEVRSEAKSITLWKRSCLLMWLLTCKGPASFPQSPLVRDRNKNAGRSLGCSSCSHSRSSSFSWLLVLMSNNDPIPTIRYRVNRHLLTSPSLISCSLTFVIVHAWLPTTFSNYNLFMYLWYWVIQEQGKCLCYSAFSWRYFLKTVSPEK